jgi:hypothetical protein
MDRVNIKDKVSVAVRIRVRLAPDGVVILNGEALVDNNKIPRRLPHELMGPHAVERRHH